MWKSSIRRELSAIRQCDPALDAGRVGDRRRERDASGLVRHVLGEQTPVRAMTEMGLDMVVAVGAQTRPRLGWGAPC